MLVILMGLPGSGKTTLSRMVSEEFGFSFYDIDDKMPESYREKMRNNQLVTDEERDAYINDMIKEFQETLRSKSVAAALVLMRDRHRKLILESIPNSILFKLDAPFEVLASRLRNREGHFFKKETLKKSYDSEDPLKIEHIEVDVDRPLDVIYDEIKSIIISKQK